jgi:hypothetical protein
VDAAAGRARLEEQVVEDEAQVGLAGAVVDQLRFGRLGQGFGEQGLDELVQVIDLLQLAPAVLVELAVAGQDVQFLEQFDGLAGALLPLAFRADVDDGHASDGQPCQLGVANVDHIGPGSQGKERQQRGKERKNKVAGHREASGDAEVQVVYSTIRPTPLLNRSAERNIKHTSPA